MTSAEKLLRELIALPSVNPAFLPAGDSRAGEKRITDFLAATAARSGLDIEFQKVFPNRSNLLARFSPAEKIKQRILLAPHLDTVNVVSEEQFHPRKKGDRLFGRGACDTKGSVAAMLSALCEVAQSRQRPRATEIIFAGLVDEENGQGGSRVLAKSKLKADLAIVGEPTRLKLVTAHKGSLWLQLEARGEAAHGARPELGRNAIHAMARVVDFLETSYRARLRCRHHPLLGHATISVGTIHGGTQANIVPDFCSIAVDRRTLPGENEAGVRREIKLLLRKNHLAATFANSKTAACLPLETNPHLPMVRQFLRVIGQTKPAGVDFFCDASVLSHAAIPSVVFGPGDIAQAHTADEWISVSQLERAKDMLVRFLKSLP